MNILITGANGFIGKHLVNNLSDTHSIIELYNGSNYSNNKLKFTCDLLDINSVNNFLNEQLEIDVIIHLASKIASEKNRNDLSLLYENIKMYEHLNMIIDKFKPKKVINFSSIAVYPNKDGEYFENSEIRPSVNAEGLYGLSKFCGENILDFFNKKNPVNIVHLRVAQVYGHGMRNDRIFNIMRSELEDKNCITVYGNGKRISNFIEVNKVVEKVNFFIENNIKGIFNIGDKNISYKSLAINIIKEYGNDKSIIKCVDKGVSSKCFINCNKLKEMELLYE